MDKNRFKSQWNKKLINDCQIFRRGRKKFEDFAREMAFKIEI